jgi:uncharacterized protein YneF (UPF0154 family)
LPQRNPKEYYRQLLYSFNTPDFTSHPVKTNARQMGRKLLSDKRIATMLRLMNK